MNVIVYEAAYIFYYLQIYFYYLQIYLCSFLFAQFLKPFTAQWLQHYTDNVIKIEHTAVSYTRIRHRSSWLEESQV